MSTQRISNATAFFLIGAAVSVDALQALLGLLAFIPFVGIPLAFLLQQLVNISALFLFGIWFSSMGISLIKKRPLGFMGTTVLELVPMLNAVPAWSMFVATTVWKERSAPDAV